jgi:hypothetical protein
MACRQAWGWPVCFGSAALLWKIPFVYRYDLNFQTEGGVYYLMSKGFLRGEFPVYMWESDYNGTLPQAAVAVLFGLFGSSIQLAALVSALAYAVATALGVAYVQRHFGRHAAVGSGVFVAVGIPYGLKYTTVPAGSGYDFSLLMPFVFLWLTVLIYQRGWNFWRCVIVGLLAGHCWYLSRQSILSFATVGVVFLCDSQGRKLLREALAPRWIALLIGAAIVGCLPEITYKLTHVPKHNLMGVASLNQMWSSMYWLCRVIPSYFNGDPLARQPEGQHYLQHHHSESFPQSVVDYLGIVIAGIVIVFIFRQLKETWRERNMPQILLAAYPVMNIIGIVFSRVAAGEYYAPKRYLYTSGIVFLLWTGIRTVHAFRLREWALAGLLALLVPVSFVHQLRLLDSPDELRDYRALVAQLEQAGYHHGVTFYSYAFTLISLSDERLSFACLDYNDHASYSAKVKGQKTLVLVHPVTMTNLPDQTRFFKDDPAVYRRDAASRPVGELAYTVYRRHS